MTKTRISFTDITAVSHYDKGTPWKFHHVNIELAEEDSLAIGEYVRRILGMDMTTDLVLTRIFEMGIHKAKEQVSLDRFLDECDAEAGE